MSAINSRHGQRLPSGSYKLILGPQPVLVNSRHLDGLP